MPADRLHDVIVIGAGAAGVSAAIEGLDVQLDVVLFEAAGGVGGQIEEIPHTMRNVVVAEDGNDAVIGALARHAATLGERLRLGQEVNRVDVAARAVAVGGASYRARTLLVATGSRQRRLELAPEGAFGGDVTYLVEPHLDRFAGRPTVVMGGGDSAALDALALADTGSSVTLVHRSPHLTARRDVVERIRASDRIEELSGWALHQLHGADHLEAVEVARRDTGERRRIDARGLVLKLGREPRVELVRGQVELGTRGGVVVDAELRTSNPGTFAAGDVVDGTYERVATAVGQGSLAVRSILAYLQTSA